MLLLLLLKIVGPSFFRGRRVQLYTQPTHGHSLGYLLGDPPPRPLQLGLRHLSAPGLGATRQLGLSYAHLTLSRAS